MHFGYIVDLASIKLSDDPNELTWMQMLSVGKRKHPRYGEIDITEDRIKKFALSVNERVRGIAPALDYDHKEGPAAGWIEQAEHRDTGLWVGVRFTPRGRQAVADGEYRYTSADFADEWTDNAAEGAKTFKDVLFGGALTNRPFLKDMAAINLSELGLSESDIEKAFEEVLGDHMLLSDEDYDPFLFRDIPKSERKNHPAGDFAGKGDSFPIFKCGDVTAAFHALGRAGSDNLSTDAIRSNIIRIAKRKGFESCLPASVKASEDDLELKDIARLYGLSEDATEEQIKAKIAETLKPQNADDVKALREELDETKKSLAEQRAQVTLSELHRKGVPAAFDEDIKKHLLGDSEAKPIDQLLAEIADKGLVPLGPSGIVRDGTDPDEERNKSKAAQFTEKVEAYKVEHKVDITEAMRAVTASDPELARAYKLKDVPREGVSA